MVDVRRGSFTVEAALLMQVLLLSIVAMIYLFAYVYNRTYLTAAAWEEAIMESQRSDLSLQAGASTNRQEKLTDEKNTVIYESQLRTVWVNWAWTAKVEAVREKPKPVSWIWKQIVLEGLVP